MPSSNLLVAPTVLHLINQVHKPGGTILDIGPGWGKYATLIREYVDPTAQISGLELWDPYIHDHRLTSLYDPVVHGDAREMTSQYYSQFDVVLIADVIEHMTGVEGSALINKIAGWIIISTPRDFFSNPRSCPPPEKHVSHWNRTHFEAIDRFDYLDETMLKEVGGLIVRLKPQ
jgi:2-polyprenyl-3-methyl-5-hydroxy-6-metoxy-1,4-benzoquinol methylase